MGTAPVLGYKPWQSPQQRQELQARSDSEFYGKVTDLLDKRDALVSKTSTLQKGTQDYDEAFNALREVDTNLRTLYHPQNNPGAIEKFGHLLTDHLGIKVKEGGTGTNAGNKVTLPQLRRDKEASRREQGIAGDERQARLDAAAGPLSPEQQAISPANATNAGTLASVQGAIKSFDKLNPNATPEERQGFFTDLIQKAYGTTVAGNWKIVKGTLNGQPASVLFDSKSRQIRTLNGETLPPDLLATWVPETSVTEASRKRTDYDEFKKKHTEYQGTFEQWSAEQAGLGRNAAIAAKPPNKDDRWIAISQKLLQGQPVSEDDIAYKGAYDLWVQATKVNPGVARMIALNDNRYTWVYDLNDQIKP